MAGNGVYLSRIVTETARLNAIRPSCRRSFRVATDERTSRRNSSNRHPITIKFEKLLSPVILIK